MSRVYKVPLALTVTNDGDQDIFMIAAPADRLVVLHGFSLTSAYTTDERVKLRLVTRAGAGSGGAGATEEPVDQGNPLAAEAAVTTLVTAPGTLDAVLGTWRWSQQNELLYLPTPEIRDVVSPAGFIGLHLNTAMGGSRDWDGWVAWEEV